jgi:hypothetical protein
LVLHPAGVHRTQPLWRRFLCPVILC